MKKLLTVAVALLLALSMSATAMAVEGIPGLNVNPQQMGHIAFLEAEYGTRRAKKILDSYQKPDSDLPEGLIPEPENPLNGSIEIPQPGSQVVDLHKLRVGDYFTMHGRRYIVGRITFVGPSPVLVGFPIDANGVANPADPRYFYL